MVHTPKAKWSVRELYLKGKYPSKFQAWVVSMPAG